MNSAFWIVFLLLTTTRQQWKVEHKLSDILFFAIVAVIGGAEGWEEIEDFGVDHLEWLQQYGDFRSGIPIHATIVSPCMARAFVILP